MLSRLLSRRVAALVLAVVALTAGARALDENPADRPAPQLGAVATPAPSETSDVGVGWQ